MYCKYCKNEIDTDSVFCEHCGEKVYSAKGRSTAEIIQAEGQEAAVVQPKNYKRVLKVLGPFEFMVLALIFGIIGQVYMFHMKVAETGGIYFGISIILFMVAHFLGKNTEAHTSMNRRTEIILFILIVLTGIFFRVYMITTVPAGCFSDEAQNAAESLNLIKGEKIHGSRFPAYIERNSSHNPAYYVYLIAIFTKFFGIGALQSRMASVISGILAVPAAYFLIRTIFGARMAIVGGFFVAFMRWHVNFSRVGFHAIFAVLIVTLAFYFTYRIYKNRTWRDFVMWGVTVALTQYTYIPARFVLPILVIYAVFLMISDFSFVKTNYKKIILAILVGFVTFLPMFNFIIKHPKLYFNSRSETLITKQATVTKFYQGKHTVKSIMKENFQKTWGMFNIKGDGNPRHNLPGEPQLDFIMGALAVMGFGYMVLRLFTPLSMLFVTAFGFFMLGGFLTIEAPQGLRTILVIPSVLVFSVIVIERLFRYGEAEYGRIGLIVLTSLTSLMVVYMGAENYNKYFNIQAHHPGCWEGFATDEWLMANDVKEKGDSIQWIMMPHNMHSYTFRYLTTGLSSKNWQPFEPGESIPIRSTAKKTYAYVLSKEYMPILPLLESMYPNGTFKEVNNKYNKYIMRYFIYYVPYEDVYAQQHKVEKNGLRGRYYRNTGWVGSPAIDRVDPFILFNWTVAPLPGKFSARWTGKIKAEKSGEYSFVITSNDISQLFIDGKLIANNLGRQGTSRPVVSATGNIFLEKGLHKIELKYSNSITHTRVLMEWRVPDSSVYKVVPHEVLFP